MGVFYKVDGDYLYLNIKALPGASKTGIGNVTGDKLKIRVAAAPQDGKANEELRSFLSKILKIPKRDVVITSGEKSQIKVLRLPALTKDFFDRY